MMMMMMMLLLLLRALGEDAMVTIEQLMVRHRCYDLMPHSCKLVLFDVRLEVCE